MGIGRSFTFVHTLESSKELLGEIFIGELLMHLKNYSIGEQALLTNLKSDSSNRNLHIIGSIGVKNLSNELATYTHKMKVSC